MRKLSLLFFFFLVSCQAENPVAVLSTTFPAENEKALSSSDTVKLNCDTYMTTVWGDGPGQWGFPDGLEYRPATLLPLEFDDAGKVYFADYINLRLLRYDEVGSQPAEISLKPFKSEVPWLFPFRFSIDIYQN